MTDQDPTPPPAETPPTPPAPPAAETPPAETPPAEDVTTPVVEVAASAPVPAPSAPPAPRKPTDGRWWWGTGRRKASVARVRIRPGNGSFTVNKRPMDEFFNGERDRKDLQTVLEKTRTTGTVDVHVNVIGGGFTGQSGAIVLGLARALNRYDPTLEPILRDNNFLTRDPRRVERKKYGQPGARARFQFSKR